MTGLLQSELLKLRTTRTAVVLALGLLAITAAGTVGVLLLSDESPLDLQDGLPSAAAFATLFALLFGILVMTGEFRHGTATPTFLASPRRERVLVAKVLAATLGGLALALAASALVYLVAIPWLVVQGDAIRLFGSEPLGTVAAIVAGAAIWGALGVGLGAIVRSQVGAMIGGLVWLLIVESIVGGLLPGAAPYLPGRALGAIFDDPGEGLSVWGGVAVSLGYAAAFCVAGTLLTARRDIT